MRKIKHCIIPIGLVIFLFSSCTQRILDFTLISSKNVDMTRSADFIRGKSRVLGRDMVHIVIFIPSGTVSIKEALDKAIESIPGCVALLDGVIYSKFWWIPYLYGESAVIVKGLPLIDPNLVMNSEEAPSYSQIELDKSGAVKSIESLSFDQYLVLKEKLVKETEEITFENSIDIK